MPFVGRVTVTIMDEVGVVVVCNRHVPTALAVIVRMRIMGGVHIW